jgi:hypothetical protein
MLPKRYAAETKILVGRFVNHDDNLEDEDLTVNLELTQRLWQEAFGVPYLNPTAAPPVISHQQLLVKKKALGGMGAGLMLTSLAAVALLSPVSEPAQQAQQVSTRSPNKNNCLHFSPNQIIARHIWWMNLTCCLTLSRLVTGAQWEHQGPEFARRQLQSRCHAESYDVTKFYNVYNIQSSRTDSTAAPTEVRTTIECTSAHIF